jgi:hypothetical protein
MAVSNQDFARAQDEQSTDFTEDAGVAIHVSTDVGEPEEPARELTFEEKTDAVGKLLVQNNIHRDILYRILQYCNTERCLLFILEELILESPEFSTATQPPYFLIRWLVDSGGLDEFEVDEDGTDVTPERKEGLSEYEIDDLVYSFAYETNEVGRLILEQFDPRVRLTQLLGFRPDRLDTYLDVLEFLSEKHSYSEVDALLRGRPVLLDNRDTSDRPMQPSVFIDKLAACGGITWNEGWLITDEGREILNTVRRN